ncbi:MAG: adenylate/guanylate cyclase domain-containing protein [Treponema sp.]
MKINKSALFLLFLVSLFFNSCHKIETNETLGATDERAVVNISNPEFMETSFCNVSSKWEYYRNSFLNASLFYNNAAVPLDKISPKANSIVSFPHIWKKPQETATYHLRVTGLKPSTNYSVFMYDRFSTAGDLFCNGEFVYSLGRCTSEWTETIPERKMDVVDFSSDENGIADLVMHCSNKDYRKGGIYHSFKIAEENYVDKWFQTTFIIRLFFIGALLIIIIYQLSLFFLNKHKKSFLFLAIFSFFTMIRILFASFSVMLVLFPSIPYSFALKMEFIPIFTTPIFYCLYMLSSNNLSLRKPFIIIIEFISIVFFVICVFLPIYFVNRMVPVFQIFLVISAAYGLSLTFAKHPDGKRHINIFDLLGMLSLFIGILHDVLSYYRLELPSYDTEWVLFGIILFTILQSINTAWVQFLVSENIKKVSNEMSVINTSAYRFVPQAFLSLIGKTDINTVEPNDFCKKKIAIINTDICGFTTISEGLDSSEVFKMLNIYMDYVNPIIRYYGGFIEKVLGDGVVAVFSEGADKALLCALEMQEAMVLLQSYLTKDNLPTVEIGVGVHYGEVVIGTVGNKNRISEVIVSPVVDEVMAIESFNRICHDSVIASEECVNNIVEKDIFSATVIQQTKDKKCNGYNGKVYAIGKSVKY